MNCGQLLLAGRQRYGGDDFRFRIGIYVLLLYWPCRTGFSLSDLTAHFIETALLNLDHDDALVFGLSANIVPSVRLEIERKL